MTNFGRFEADHEPKPGNPTFGRTDDPMRVLGSYRDTAYGSEALRLASEKLGMKPAEYIRRALRLAFARDLDHVLKREEHLKLLGEGDTP